jgi:hypothetical protein
MRYKPLPEGENWKPGYVYRDRQPGRRNRWLCVDVVGGSIKFMFLSYHRRGEITEIAEDVLDLSWEERLPTNAEKLMLVKALMKDARP